MLAVYLAFQFAVLGTSGLACPVQLIKPLATAPLTIWQAELVCMAGMLLSAVSLGSIVQWLDLLPHGASGLYGELMRTNLFHIFGLRIWSPWMFLFSQAVLAAAFSILCLRTWKRGR